jgi:RNA 3'-terminal phosphate cyclase
MFDGFPKSKFDIVTSDGVLRGTTEAIATGKEIIVPDQNVIIQPGDEMRRTLPNGTDETFDVIDPVFMQETFDIPGHFQVKVRKKGMFPHGTGGNYTISVTGPNSRVNIGSTDQSTNINIDQSVISKVRQALTAQVEESEQRAALLSALADMEQAGDKSALSAAYQRFISSAANHMSVIAPFLPALGQMFGG